MIRQYKEVPLPDEVIPLYKISSLKFFNVSYREYMTICGEWIIEVYPFAVLVTSVWQENGSLIDWHYFRHYSKRSGYHHNDFVEDKCDYDPCVIFEDVSGVKIHRGESDDHLMYLDHTDDIRGFEEELRGVISNRRNGQIESILKI
jgi:hypothetical protein